MASELPIPVEIPWTLMSTTQPLVAGQPDETTISLFSFRPDAQDFADQFPDQTLVFLKVTASISPAAFPPGTAPPAAAFLGEGIPAYHVQLDMKIRKESGELGTIRPYFHDAAPLRRGMIESGVLGADSFSGESDRQVVGKSGSQMYESSSSRAITDTTTGGAMVFGIGVSSETTTTSVRGNRAVTQVSDTTTRDASQERRELTSHMTKVENVLTLLSAKYVGTPYLRFSLAPRPLAQLSADSSDPSLWYGQLLQRRSSGIEGVQEFTMIVLVPKGEDFCVSARLRRVCLLDNPPAEPDFDEPFDLGPSRLGRLLDYLYKTYPIGTPLSDLDVDLTDALSPAQNFPRPALENWWVCPAGLMIAGVISTAAPARVASGYANYKTFLELWLETLRDEYEQALARSPLERGLLFGESRTLDTCFTFTNGGLSLLNSATSVSPLSPMHIHPGDLLGAVGGLAALSSRRSVKARALETVTRWNQLDRRLRVLLANAPLEGADKPTRFNDPKLVHLLIERWAKVAEDDPRNLTIKDAATMLGLGRARLSLLAAAGVHDLKSLAQALAAAPAIERYNRVATSRLARGRDGQLPAGVGEAIENPIGRKEAEAIVAEIGAALFGGLDQPAVG